MFARSCPAIRAARSASIASEITGLFLRIDSAYAHCVSALSVSADTQGGGVGGVAEAWSTTVESDILTLQVLASDMFGVSVFLLSTPVTVGVEGPVGVTFSTAFSQS